MKSNQQYYCLHPWTMALAAAGLLTLPSVVPADPTTNAPTTLGGTPIGTKANTPWWTRFDQANRDDLGAPAYSPPAPVPAGTTPPPQPYRRGNPTPFDSPPYPNGEWQIGGTEIIGDRNITTDYPLMESI